MEAITNTVKITYGQLGNDFVNQMVEYNNKLSDPNLTINAKKDIATSIDAKLKEKDDTIALLYKTINKDKFNEDDIQKL
jgi:hypothetical protein